MIKMKNKGVRPAPLAVVQALKIWHVLRLDSGLGSRIRVYWGLGDEDQGLRFKFEVYGCVVNAQGLGIRVEGLLFEV